MSIFLTSFINVFNIGKEYVEPIREEVLPAVLQKLYPPFYYMIEGTFKAFKKLGVGFTEL